MTGVVVVMAERYGIHIEKAKVVPSMANGFRASPLFSPGMKKT